MLVSLSDAATVGGLGLTGLVWIACERLGCITGTAKYFVTNIETIPIILRVFCVSGFKAWRLWLRCWAASVPNSLLCRVELGARGVQQLRFVDARPPAPAHCLPLPLLSPRQSLAVKAAGFACCLCSEALQAALCLVPMSSLAVGMGWGGTKRRLAPHSPLTARACCRCC